MQQTHGHGIAGQIVNITQRCDKQQFLLNDDTDRRRWLYWLFQARKLYGLCVLNYVVTSNHVHVLVQDPGRRQLDASMRLINRHTTRELNRYHRRRGALWEAEFQATAVQTNAHLARCMNYIDMNMVRAGEVQHPGDWRCGGYYESMHPCRRGGRIDHAQVHRILQFDSASALQSARDGWIAAKLASASLCRESYWTDSIAVGDLAFALKMKRAMAYTQPGRRAQKERGCFAVR
ncbi:MAG: transposase [Granulosicoccus sp.]